MSLPAMSFANMRADVLDPLYDACVWDEGTQRWVVPREKTPLSIDDAYWAGVLGSKYPAGQTITSCDASFFQAEADSNRQNKPRLDIVLVFSGGTTVRYHPKAALIWSTDSLPTDAMIKRIRLRGKLDAKVLRSR